MGLTGFNRQRKRTLTEEVGDARIADKLVANGINDPRKLKQASDEDLSFLSEEEIAQCRGEEVDNEEPSEDNEEQESSDEEQLDENEEADNEDANLERNQQRHELLQEAGAEFIEDPGKFVMGDLEYDLAEVNEASDEEFADMLTAVEEKAGNEEEQEEVSEHDLSPTERSNNFEDVPEDAEFPWQYGPSHYFLSNGNKVQGQKAAQKAQEQLDENEG